MRLYLAPHSNLVAPSMIGSMGSFMASTPIGRRIEAELAAEELRSLAEAVVDTARGPSISAR